MTKFKATFILGAFAAAALLASGCSKTKTNLDVDAEGTGRTVTVQDMAVVVPNPEEPWTKLQIEYMQMAAKEAGVTLHVVGINGTTDAQVKLAVGSASASRSVGMLIQAPREDCGVPIRDDVETFGIPTVAINTRLRDSETRKYLDIPFFGIDNRDLGAFASNEAIAEAVKRGWKASETGVLIFGQPDGGKMALRARSMSDVIAANGYSASQTKSISWVSSSDAESKAASALTGPYKNWMILGGADAPVLAAVRASEAKGLTASNVIGVSIGGLGTLEELQKPETGFFGSLLIGPKRHSYDPFMRLVNAIKRDVRVDPMPEYNNGIWLTRATIQKEMKDQMLDKLPAYSKTIQP